MLLLQVLIVKFIFLKNIILARIKEIEANGARIIRVPGDYEQSVIFSQEAADKKEYYDANAGGNNTITQLRAYGEIAYEIYDELT